MGMVQMEQITNFKLGLIEQNRKCIGADKILGTSRKIIANRARGMKSSDISVETESDYSKKRRIDQRPRNIYFKFTNLSANSPGLYI